ncbi:GIY-YIG nuclease family protein [Sphingomonas sp. 28-63-12]|uniref:GIY-YIG nuclease family protein n=1 Tax=Sphingomonas sp. 28-63-12 TaxID=1970434 RepID=UPI000BC845F5|nr:MAG: excinuclease ABC subunit C [Sphingomonas sp. 28-63-12]
MALGGWTYIMASNPRGMLYIGVTAYLAKRVTHHREDRGSAFCRKYGIKTLVLVERHEEIAFAIAREKVLKSWKRAWKIELIEASNPMWHDLYQRIL